nr:hypothetical protein [Tanacetum cinerariifolium]
MSRMQLNSKFVNNMLPEWDRFVTALYSPSSLTSSSTQVPQPVADNLHLDSSLSPTENLIENLTLTQSYKTFLPQTNNQLRTSSNARNQATVQDDRVVVQNVQGRQNRGQGMNPRGGSTAGYGGAQNRVGNVNPGQARPAQENGVALDAEQLLFLAGGQDNAFDDDVDEQHVQDLALNVDNMFQADDCDTFDSDVDEAPTAQTMFKANLSSADPVTDEVGPSYDLDTLSENPLCLTRAKQVQLSLYNGHEIIKDNHAPAIVHNTEDTLEMAGITRKKMNAKMNDPECVTRKVKIAPHDYSKENFLATFTPQKQLTPEQIFWSNDLIKLKSEALKEQTTVSRPIKALTVYPPNKPVTLVPKVLPTKRQVKIHLFTLIQLFLEFDKTCKKRITPTGLTDGERGFEQTKKCYLKEVIPSFKTLKSNFEGIQKALTKEIKEMKDVFKELEAEVAQYAVDRKHDASERKNLLIANDNLIAECLSKEVFSVATNAELNVARFIEMHVANTIVEARCLALEVELANLRDKSHHDNQQELINHFSKLENTKVITDLKLREEHDIEKMLSMEKQIKVLNEIVYKRSQSIQTIHMMAPKVSTYNGRPTFANPRYLKQAQSEIPCLYAFPYDQNTHANRLILDWEETLALERESRSKLNKDSVRPYDYTKLSSLYEIFKPPTQEYETQLAHANEIRRKIELKKLIGKGKGKSMDTKFNRSSVVRQPNAQRIPKPSVLAKKAKSWCDEFEALMKNRFQMSSMGELTFFLGLQIASTPIETNKPLVKDAEAADVDIHLYRSMIGSLMYLTVSRPDIMYAICTCSRFQVTSKTSHLQAVKRIFRYLKGQPKMGLWYSRESAFDLEAYSDSDYAGCKKQTIVATSTTEAEYVAAANCCGQVLWIQNQMLDYGFNFMNTKIYIDNESTICIVKNPMFHSKTKHIEIRHHFIRDAYEKKLIQVLKIQTDNNVADLLTKAFDVSRSVFSNTEKFGYEACEGADYSVNKGRSTDKIRVLNAEAEGVSAAGETLSTATLAISTVSVQTEAKMDMRKFFKCWFHHHTTIGHQFTMSNRHQELASPKANDSCFKIPNINWCGCGCRARRDAVLWAAIPSRVTGVIGNREDMVKDIIAKLNRKTMRYYLILNRYVVEPFG